jgi:hypothetical protein
MGVGAVAVAVVPEPKLFDKGLVFVKDTDILLSGYKWTIVVNIALDDYSNLVELMKTELKLNCWIQKQQLRNKRDVVQRFVK